MKETSKIYTKRRVSFMGGNLDPVTSHSYQKNKSSSQEPIFLDESENENIYVMISGII